MRVPENNSIMKSKSVMNKLFRQMPRTHHFIQVRSPKSTQGESYTGAGVMIMLRARHNHQNYVSKYALA